MKIRTVLVGILAVLACGPILAQQDFSQVEIKATRVTDGIYMLEGAGGNLGLSVGEDSVFLIDDQFAPLTEKIVAAVQKVDNDPIAFVFNTHYHGDHTGGNENLGKAGALIVAHDNVRQRMSVEQFRKAFNRHIPASPDGALPIVTFSKDVTFHLNGDEIHAFHVTSAHTDGDAIVHFTKANVLHMGDVMFSGFYPFIDVDAGGSLDGIVAACDRALEIVDGATRIIPGHGPLSGRDDLEAYRDMLVGVRNAVGPLVDSGKSLEQVREADPLAPWNEKWGKGFMEPDRFLEIVYRDLSEE
jgi:glyoxylase-like metal-dependent hydrolase (beta-lactamase superfamily II)